MEDWIVNDGDEVPIEARKALDEIKMWLSQPVLRPTTKGTTTKCTTTKRTTKKRTTTKHIGGPTRRSERLRIKSIIGKKK